METVGDRLKGLLVSHPNYGERGQSRLSRDTNVPQPTISRIIREGTVPEMETIAALATKFEVTCEWLLTGRGPKYIAQMYGSAGKNDALGVPPEDRHTLSHPAQMLVEEISLADEQGVRPEALNALREMVRALMLEPIKTGKKSSEKKRFGKGI